MKVFYQSALARVELKRDSVFYTVPCKARLEIEKEKGECFAFTIKEAEKLGFRHAMRWQGNV